MKLKERNPSWFPSITSGARGAAARRRRFLAVAIALFLAGAAAHEPVGRAVSAAAYALRTIPRRIVARLGSNPRRLILDIPHEGMMRLAYIRERALERGVLLREPEDFVSARVSSGEDKARAKVRLKGDWTDHLKTDRWSFRIRLKSGETLFGLREFSIQHPGTRSYLSEWFYHAAMAREAILAPRYAFVEVTLNGRDLGVYALEEHFEKRLVESARRREGPILKFSEDDLWREWAKLYPNHAEPLWDISLEDTAPIDVFKSSSTLRDPARREAFLEAASLLAGFRAGDFDAERVFDIERVAAYLAVSELLGATHGLTWHNLRFYYDPVAGRLEPVAFDGDAGKLIGRQASGSQRSKFWTRMFESPAFVGAYVRKLEEISKDGYLASLLSDTEKERTANLRTLQRDFPDVGFDPSVFEANRVRLAAIVDPVRSVQAYFETAPGGGLRIRAANIQGLPIEILGIIRADGSKAPLAEPVVLSEPGGEKANRFQSIDFGPARAADADAALRLAYRFLGARTFRTAPVFRWPYPEASRLAGRVVALEPNTGEFAFVRRSAGGLHISPGRHVLGKTLVVPSGSTLTLSAGARIELARGASIISRSPVEFLGRENAPVRVVGREGAGGILVLAGGKRSLVRYARFENLGPPSALMTAAVAFQDSPVTFEGVEFIGSRGEDALNLVRSDFRIENSLFSGSESDAFDADFSNGSISSAAFTASGNDAIDFSGSVVSLSHVAVRGAGDKGVSAGEMSRVTASGLSVRGARACVASKDISVVTVSDSRFLECGVGLAAYRKKSEFGPGEIRASAVEIDAGRAVFVESGSRVFLDGVIMPTDAGPLPEALAGPDED